MDLRMQHDGFCKWKHNHLFRASRYAYCQWRQYLLLEHRSHYYIHYSKPNSNDNLFCDYIQRCLFGHGKSNCYSSIKHHSYRRFQQYNLRWANGNTQFFGRNKLFLEQWANHFFYKYHSFYDHHLFCNCIQRLLC